MPRHVDDFDGIADDGSYMTSISNTEDIASNNNHKKIGEFAKWCSSHETLHGREGCVQELLNAYERCCGGSLQRCFLLQQQQQQQRPEAAAGVVVITGPSGVGKTALALHLQEQVVHRDVGCLLTGKFDQLSSSSSSSSSSSYCNNRPTDAYTPFVEAITNYVHWIVTAHESEERGRGEEQEEEEKKEYDYDDDDDRSHHHHHYHPHPNTTYYYGSSRKRIISKSTLRMALLENLDLSELRVLRATIPALGQIIGNNCSSSNHHHHANNMMMASARKIALQGADAEARLAHIFVKFIKTIASQGHPVVLLLDDLQWASERASWVLIKELAKLAITTARDNHNNHHHHHGADAQCRFMLLCTCRMSDDNPSISSTPQEFLFHQSSHTEMFSKLQEEDGISAITTIELANLSEAAVEAIVSEALTTILNEEDRTNMARAIYDLTDGNAFYTLQLVQEVVEVGGEHWQSVIAHSTNTDAKSVMRHMSLKVRRLPNDVQTVLKVAACLGTTFSEECLLEGSAMSLSAFCTALRTMEEKGIIVCDPTLRTGRFQHDRFQQVSYELLPEDERAEFHLSIGRRLRALVKGGGRGRAVTAALNDDHLVLAAANQLRHGIHLISDIYERNDLSRFFLRAGEAAASASSFTAAAQYLNCAIKLLNKYHWTNQYELSLVIHNTAAEIEYYNSNLFRVDALVARIINHANCFNDTLVARFTQIYSLGTRGDMDQAIDDGMSLLKELGEPFPRKKATMFRIGLELLRCKHMLFGKTESEILNLPLMKSKQHLTAMRLMNIIYGFAYFTRKELMPLLASRLVQITLRHGISEMSSIGFAALGLVFSTLGFVDEAYRFSQLGILISEKYPSDEWQGHIAANIYAFAYPLKHPLRESLAPLLAGHRAALVEGDIHVSMLCASIKCMFTMHAGYPLPFVLNELQTYRKLCIQYGQHLAQVYFDIMAQFCLNMMGASNNPMIFTGDVMNEEKTLLEMEERKNPFALAALVNSKHSVAVYLNDYHAADALASSSKFKSVKSKLLPIALQIHHFLQGLASAALSKTSRYHRQQAHRLLSKLRKCAQHSPANFENKVYLVEAELASSSGNYDEAMLKYDMSIQLAKEQQCLREQALACERAGYSLRECGKYNESIAFFSEARSLYVQWGARIKVQQLDAVLAATPWMIISQQDALGK